MKHRLVSTTVIASLVAALAWFPLSTQVADSIYCYPGDPPEVYKACLAYNAGIQQQVSNQQALQNIQGNIIDAEAKINALNALIKSIGQQIDAQNALIAQTKAQIAELDRQIRFKVGELTRLQADVAVRDQLLDQRMRYVDSHGPINYVELVLTAASFNDLVNRMIGAQQVAASDRRLLDQLDIEHAAINVTQGDLSTQRTQETALLLQQQAVEAELEKNKVIQQKAMDLAANLAVQLQAQFAQLEAQRAAINAQVAALAQAYDAAAAKAGGGNGVFEWPVPACGYSCISQGFGCVTFWMELYWPSCPYPHRFHSGIDIAGPYRSAVVAADTGIIFFYATNWGYGNYIVMIHGNGYSTYYGHLDGFAGGLSNGQIVARGDLIGYEGTSGWSTGPHLHFEIRYNNDYKDPCIWLGCCAYEPVSLTR
jgi:murein DD-endopeptidase MepM/ murein hydrolase activator NlpD